MFDNCTDESIVHIIFLLFPVFSRTNLSTVIRMVCLIPYTYNSIQITSLITKELKIIGIYCPI